MPTILKVNGTQRKVDVPGEKPLLWVLREDLGYLGPKFGCGAGLCGACTVHLDGQAIRSCITPINSVGDAAITTIEGVGASEVGKKVSAAWTALDVPQCGYCQAGQIMSAVALLETNPAPSDADIDSAMAGNLCRCGTYHRIRDAIKQAAGQKIAGGTNAR
ncbi:MULTISPECIES: (2Fe-2S)-binding protein [unclassified Novosphingobium]|uniref:(2Fe-2S)-binding protein n=1 Tax=unclassified Novosphingobium TaxID=2644732 RepID=UPI0025FC59B8|nr:MULTISPECIES: (2Fe-2S)-binding protein [unclassified Novosphingobium]HQS68212.1 (2Fe-2S)-binding protein [Novosphingobium sp.]